MNLVEMNTAADNAKIAEDYKNGILQDADWEAKAASMLSIMDSAGAEGRMVKTFPTDAAKWKNQQGMTLKEFLEKKGYTVSEHYQFDYMKMIFVGYSLSELKRLEEEIEVCSKKWSYNKYMLVSSNGVVGDSLEKAKADQLEPLYEKLRKLHDKIDAENSKKESERLAHKEIMQICKEENAYADVDNESEDNHQFVIFIIAVLAALAGVFLMFN